VNRTITPPDVVVRRLPLYARSLRYLLRDGILSVSSQELGERINVTAAQIRKDLSYFGEFGKQGIGYDVERLLNQIEHILGIDRAWAVALIGAGQLGEALIRYEGFREHYCGSRRSRTTGCQRAHQSQCAGHTQLCANSNSSTRRCLGTLY